MKNLWTVTMDGKVMKISDDEAECRVFIEAQRGKLHKGQPAFAATRKWSLQPYSPGDDKRLSEV